MHELIQTERNTQLNNEIQNKTHKPITTYRNRKQQKDT